MNSVLTRRNFVQGLFAGVAGICVEPALARAPGAEAFSVVLLGDLHYDKLEHHDLEWLQREKPDDLRQVRDYSRISSEVLPKLFSTLRDTIGDLNRSSQTRVAFLAQLGDLVEGLCGNEELAVKQDTDAIDFVRGANLGVPFLFTKGNHDITGAGATAAFKRVFHPFVAQQTATLKKCGEAATFCYAVEYGSALFCFFDAYEKDSLAWLEATLATRTARHCFVLLHPPVVPYGARSTWYLFSAEREKAQRARFLDLLGKHRAFVLGGHIHKYDMLVRSTDGGGRFLQLAVSSVISSPEVAVRNSLMGVNNYSPDQVNVEPGFSPATEKQRRAVYENEAKFVRQFEYADLPGYAVITVNGPQVTAKMYSGISRNIWRTLDLTKLLGT